MKNNELKKVCIKNHVCYYFDDIIKLEDFDLDNTLIHFKWHGNILIYDISCKTLIDSKPLHIRLDKQMDLLKFMMELDIKHCLDLENMMLFTTELDIL